MDAAVAKKLQAYFVTNARGWNVKLENNKVRIFTQSFLLDWKSIEDTARVCDLKVDDVIAHATLGVVVTLVYTGGK